ncbi:DUF1573 domain-containing protein [Mucilaginibacter sp. UR6-11]|uniref:DUF1573 domain-containing protein n=1 Tax=Mucilaginibacter sp. UR6-11 TaxID=1435644 RepID=UPI001E4E4B2F|nr:DUF1573 domain-containing protein [Mucilaginibacter sp. UR6-11]MCC8425543.1 DUF1573 domain-containing protein [Mucilaginibacter sp. UR6-11]
MKKLFLGILMAGALMACNNTSKKPVAFTTDGSDIKYDAPTFDFGKIKQSEKVSHRFKFTNTGKSPLIITNATASCGCTTPVWPKTPVLPGDTGSIAVTFNSAGKSGLQDKLITVTANSQPAQSIVHLIGEVLTNNK